MAARDPTPVRYRNRINFRLPVATHRLLARMSKDSGKPRWQLVVEALALLAAVEGSRQREAAP